MIETSLQFGMLVKRRRRALGLTQKQLALAADVGPRFIGELETGKATCQLGKALAVARAIGMELVDAGETRPATP